MARMTDFSRQTVGQDRKFRRMQKQWGRELRDMLLCYPREEHWERQEEINRKWEERMEQLGLKEESK